MVRPFIADAGDLAARLLSGPRGPRELQVAGAEVLGRAGGPLEGAEGLPGTPATELRLLDGQLAVVTGLLRQRLLQGREAAGAIVAMSELLADVHTVRFAIHEHLESQRLRRMELLDRGLAALWRIRDTDELLDVVCAAAVDCGGFDRVLLSRVTGTVLRPWRSRARRQGDDVRRPNAWVAQWPEVVLGDRLLESELVRRREPGIVLDAATDSRVHRPLVEASGVTSYVAAPVLSGDRVVGLLHADYQTGQVTELDRDVLWRFVQGFGRIHERAVLLSQVRAQRAQVLQALRTVERNLEALSTTQSGLGTSPPLEPFRDVYEAVEPRRSRNTLETVLTGRELEVLALMATGATNDRIAQRLVIATETVKTHVKRVLRKLGAENRAEAISVYLRLGAGSEDESTPAPRALPL